MVLSLRSAGPDRTAAILAAGGVFLACFGAVHTWFWAHGELVDWPTYRDYGTAILHHGRVPYRDFADEYPPGALPVFVLPALVGVYPTTFAWLMCACGLALVAAVALVDTRAAFVAALTPVLVGSLILSRFDLWPTLLLVAALAALLADRHAVGWALLAVAVTAKLWPIVVVPPAVVWSLRRGHRRAPLAGVLVAAIVVLPFLALAPAGLWHSFEGQASRPLQIESLGAAIFTTFGHPHVVSSHGSQNVAGHDAVGALLSVVEAAALVALWAAFARGPATRERFLRYAAACVCAFVALNKVLSPQYLVWLIPLVPLVRGARGVAATAVLVVACALTQIWFPLRYWAYADHFHLAWVVLLRDVALVAVLAILAWPSSGLHAGPESTTVT